MIIKDLTKKKVEIFLKICQYLYLKWNNPSAPPGARDVHCFTRHIYLHIRHTDCSDGWTHTLMIYSPSTNSLSYLSWWTSFFSLSSTLYSRSSEQVISSSTVRLPSPWAVCPGGVTLLFLGLESLLKPTHCSPHRQSLSWWCITLH